MEYQSIAGSNVCYHMESSLGSPLGPGTGIVVYEVNEVYLYIPAELCAAGFELKIAGVVRIVDKKEGAFHLMWSPVDLTHQDVASLYATQTDDWTLVENIAVDLPELVDQHDVEHPHVKYPRGELDFPEPVTMATQNTAATPKKMTATPKKKSKRSLINRKNKASPPSSPLTSEKKFHSPQQPGAMHSSSSSGKLPSPKRKNSSSPPTKENQSRENQQHTGGHTNTNTTTTATGGAGGAMKFQASNVSIQREPLNFSLSSLHSMRESTTHDKKKSLTCYLDDGRELPSLYFHDGGVNGLIQAMQRYLYLVRDKKDPSLYRCSEFKKQSKEDPLSAASTSTSQQHDDAYFSSKRGLEHFFTETVGNLIGITKAVKQIIPGERHLLDVRPGTESDDAELEEDEALQTLAVSEMGMGEEGGGEGGGGGGGGMGRRVEVDPEASLFSDCQVITNIRGKLPPRPPQVIRQPPVTMEEWEMYRNSSGQILPDKERNLRARIFAGGIDHKLRREAWKYLLNYLPFGASDYDRMRLRDHKEGEYWKMKAQWQSFTEEQEARFSRWRQNKELITKDVLRTDREYELYSDVNSPYLRQLEEILRTYVMFNFDLGYVQGMSDLLAPLIVVMENEVDAFWCFVGYMDKVEHYFEMSQAGMRTRLKQLRALLDITDPSFYKFLRDKEANNLYFCFRWLIVNFKREFFYPDIMRIWEVVWTNHLSPDYCLFIALAILQRERENIYKKSSFDFADIIEHINGLSKKIPVDPTLELAEVLCRQVGDPSIRLPEDLRTLVTRPLPRQQSERQLQQQIAEGVVGGRRVETVHCTPESSAVITV